MPEIKRVEIKATTQLKAIMAHYFLELDEAAQTNPHPQLTGAYGAALIACESLG